MQIYIAYGAGVAIAFGCILILEYIESRRMQNE